MDKFKYKTSHILLKGIPESRRESLETSLKWVIERAGIKKYEFVWVSDIDGDLDLTIYHTRRFGTKNLQFFRGYLLGLSDANFFCG